MSFQLRLIFQGDMCVSSFHQYRPIYRKVNDSSTWKLWMMGSSLLKFKQFSKGTFSSRLKLLTSKLCFRHSHVSLTISIQLMFLKVNVSATWKWWLIGNIPLTAKPSSLRDVMWKTLQLVTLIILFEGTHVSLTCSSIGFYHKVNDSSIGKMLNVEGIFCKFTLILTGEHCQRLSDF
jgi:hypothetical protein